MLASTLARRSRLVSKACLQPKFGSAVAVGGYQQQEGRGRESVNFAAKLSLALIFTTGVCFAEAKKSASTSTVDASGKKWPVISRDEVRKHDCLNNGIWVTYRNGVYDLTKFVHNHPGGRERLEGIAGQDIGDAWNLFRNHKGSALATDLLERMKIGELASHEVVNVPDPTYKPKYSSDIIYDVIIVGAGLSGLQCGSALVNAHGVDKSKILVLEAQDYVGGRVKQMTDFIRGTKIEVGAEFLHGTCLMDVCISFSVDSHLVTTCFAGNNTELTKFARANNEPLREIYCWAHGTASFSLVLSPLISTRWKFICSVIMVTFSRLVIAAHNVCLFGFQVTADPSPRLRTTATACTTWAPPSRPTRTCPQPSLRLVT
jgi:cytochrome b involved in lipid metabolism